MGNNNTPQPEKTLGDTIKDLLAEELKGTRGVAENIRPFIGAFVLVAEFTDATTGRVQYTSVTDTTLMPWQEIGLLEARMEIVKEQWRQTGRTQLEGEH